MIDIVAYKTRQDGVVIMRASARAYRDNITGEVYEDIPEGKVLGVDVDIYFSLHLIDDSTGAVYGALVYFVENSTAFTLQIDPPPTLTAWRPNVNKISPYYPDGYPLGAVHKHCGKVYRNTVANNIYAPHIYGWEEIWPWDTDVPEEFLEVNC